MLIGDIVMLLSLCKKDIHNPQHVFGCPQIYAELSTLDLWTNVIKVAEPLAKWEAEMVKAW